MEQILWLLKWILKAAIFFTLFAFALNNLHEVTLNLYFGTQWHAPLVLLVLAAFALGVAVGVLGMVPRWWRARSQALKPQAPTPLVPATPELPATPAAPTPPHGI